MYFKVFLLYFLLHQTWAERMDLTCSTIREFVDGHNLRRLRIVKGEVYNQPPATGMKYLTWDNELAKNAAEWASQYTTEQDSDDTIESDRFLINQNILKVDDVNSDLYLNINKVLDTWFNEYQNYTFGPFTGYRPEFGDYLREYVTCMIYTWYILLVFGSLGIYRGNPRELHDHSSKKYTMARSKTKYIGCGISYLPKPGVRTYYVVCNYGPSDIKYKTEEPYSPGLASNSLECGSDESNHPYGYTCSE